MQSLSMQMKNDVVGPRDDGMVSAMAGRTRRKLGAVADHDPRDDLLDRAVVRSVRVLVGSEVGGVQAAAFAERHARAAATLPPQIHTTPRDLPRPFAMSSRTSSRSPSWADALLGNVPK